MDGSELDPLDNPGGVRLEIDDLKEGAEHHFFLAAIVTIGGGDNGEMPLRRDCHGLGRAGDRMLHLNRGYHYRWNWEASSTVSVSGPASSG